MRKYFDTVFYVNSLPVAGAKIFVVDANNNYAQLYSDNGVTPIQNPVTSDSTGFYEFYVADGIYTLQMFVGTNPLRTIEGVQIYDETSIGEINNGTAPPAGNLTGNEIVPVSRGAGLLSTSLNAIGSWVSSVYKGFISNSAGAGARTIPDKLRDTVNIADFAGFDPTGASLSDTAFVNAIASLPNGGRIVIPQGSYIRIATQLIANQGVEIWSAVRNDLSSNTNGGGAATARPVIQWAGAAGGYMYTVKPAVIGNGIWGGGTSGIEWDGNSLAAVAVHLDNTKFAKFDGKVRNTTFAAVVVDSASGTPGNFSQQNEITLEYVWGTTVACQNSHGLVLGGNTINVPATQQRVRVAAGLVYNGAMVRISETDNCTIDFLNCAVQSPGTGVGLALINAGAQPADHTLVKHMAGKITLDNGLIGTKVLHYVSEAGGITQLAGSSLWDGELVDYVTGKSYKSVVFALRDKLDLPSYLFYGDAATSSGKYASLWQSVTLIDGADSSVSAVIPAPYAYDGGQLTGLEFWIGSNGTSGGNYSFNILAGVGTNGSSVGIVTPAVNQGVVVAAGAQFTQQKYTVTFSSPLTYAKDQNIYLNILRHGAAGTDTNTDPAFFGGARLLYTGTGPNSAGSGTYYIPQW